MQAGRRAAAPLLVSLTATLLGASGPAWSLDGPDVSGLFEAYGLEIEDRPDAQAARAVVTFVHGLSPHSSFTWEISLDAARNEEDGRDHDLTSGQIYLGLDLGRRQTLRLGIITLPVGLLNEADAPETFFGAAMNPVERAILPLGWTETGLVLAGPLGHGLTYDVGVTSGLAVPVDGNEAFRTASGARSPRVPSLDELAVTGRLRWSGIPGVILGASVHRARDVTADQGVGARLVEAHADLRRGPFGLRALHARWALDDARPASLGYQGRTTQQGWYVEPSLRGVVARLPGEAGVFLRLTRWDDLTGVAGDRRVTRWNTGLNYWPLPALVVKLDVWRDDPDAGEARSGIGLALGGSF